MNKQKYSRGIGEEVVFAMTLLLLLILKFPNSLKGGGVGLINGYPHRPNLNKI